MALTQFASPNQMFSLIDNRLINVLLKHKQKGDPLIFAKSENGQIHVEIKYGPLNCFVKKFVTNKATFQQIKQEISSIS